MVANTSHRQAAEVIQNGAGKLVAVQEKNVACFSLE
jgi:hypothetical protein